MNEYEELEQTILKVQSGICEDKELLLFKDLLKEKLIKVNELLVTTTDYNFKPLSNLCRTIYRINSDILREILEHTGFSKEQENMFCEAIIDLETEVSIGVDKKALKL
jgi:hypothetical protein